MKPAKSIPSGLLVGVCANQSFELLENRCLLSGVELNGFLYFTEASSGPNGGQDLIKSDLDGSNRLLLKHWSGQNAKAPTLLTPFHDKVFFSANWPNTDYSGQEPWVTDGTPAGTFELKNIYGGANGSNPHDFMIVNDHLLFIAKTVELRDQIFVSDGTTDGTIQLISPFKNGYANGLSNLVRTSDLLYAETYDGANQQLERWQTDGTVEGTVQSPGGMIVNGVLRIFGTDGNDHIGIWSNGISTGVVGLGVAPSAFNNSDFSSIVIYLQKGDDFIDVDSSVTMNVTILGGAGADSVNSGSGNDQISDSDSNSSILGGAGDDSIVGSGYIEGDAGNDTIAGSGQVFAGDGDDQITSGNAGGYFDGGEGNDTIVGAYNGTNTLLGGDGNDILTGHMHGHDSMVGGAGNDSLFGYGENDTLIGGAGADTLNGGTGVDSIESDASDTVIEQHEPVLLNGLLSFVGSAGDDAINIWPASDGSAALSVEFDGTSYTFSLNDVRSLRLDLLGGNDSVFVDPKISMPVEIYGGDGNDNLQTGAGDDYLDGGDGNDTLVGNEGNDQLLGRAGNDSIVGGAGNDTMNSEEGADSLDGGTGNNKTAAVNIMSAIAGGTRLFYVYGTNASESILVRRSNSNSKRFVIVCNGVMDKTDFLIDDFSFFVLDGRSGNDRLSIDPSLNFSAKFYGGAGDDTMVGGGGADRMYGGDGFDWISGGAGYDTIYGEAGNDRIFGGDGKDYLDGGAGNNVLRGEGGLDRIAASKTRDDFRGNAGDLINFLAT